MMAREDDEIAGYHIAAGSQVGWSDYLLGQSGRLWEKPQRFNPARFLGEALGRQHRYQAIPFGGGRHRCMGVRFAQLQAQFALTMIGQRFHIQPREGEIIRHGQGFPVPLKGGYRVTLRLRAAAPTS
jgi:enediyne biosynthesis protein E7